MATRDDRNWMWGDALELLDRAERLHRQFFQPSRAGARMPCWSAPGDVFETEREVWAFVAMPGVEPDRIELRVENGELVVVGERLLPAELRRAAIRRLEIPHGRFECRLELPPGRFEVEERELANGIIRLRLRKIG